MTKTNGNSCTDTPTEPRPSSEIYYAKLRPVWNPPEVARGTSRIKTPLRSGQLAGTVLCFSYVQEQTQIIAIAIGKAIPMALAIVKANAKSGFTSGRTLSTDMSLTPPLG